MKTFMITARYLAHSGACASQLGRFRQLFPDGVVPTEKLATELVDVFDWEWAIHNLLDNERGPQAEAWYNAYYEKYVGQLDTAREKLHEAGCTTAAWQDYKTACQAFYDGLKAEYACVFVRHFIAQGGRELLPEELSNGVEDLRSRGCREPLGE